MDPFENLNKSKADHHFVPFIAVFVSAEQREIDEYCTQSGGCQ